MLACMTDEPRVWRSLEAAARKADPGLRMEMLNNIDYPDPNPTQRRLRLAFLAAFLNDKTVRDITMNPAMYESIYACFLLPQLEVRNFAAMRISRVLGTPADPTAKWTEPEWAALRELKGAAVKKELAHGGKKVISTTKSR